jgi:hypothetical protein
VTPGLGVIRTESASNPLSEVLPNPYEAPVCQETAVSYERILAVFFRCFPWQGQRPGSWAHFISFYRCRCSMLHHTRLAVLPPSRWRVQRDFVVSSTTSQPLGALLPSSAPGRLHVVHAPVRFRLGGGAAPITLGRPSPYVKEPERVSHQPQSAQG